MNRKVEYILLKVILIIIGLWIFFNPSQVFAGYGYDLAIDGIVVCRSLAFTCALYIASTLIDNIAKN